MVAELPKTPVRALIVTGTVKFVHCLAAAEPASRAIERRLNVILSWSQLRKHRTCDEKRRTAVKGMEEDLK